MQCGNKRMPLVLLLAAALVGCAGPGGPRGDPIEPFNRAMFSFNETVDDAVLRPVARGYRAALPELLRTGVSNFFSNLEDVWIGANNVLQGKAADGVQDLARFIFNSTFGLLGVLDVSTDFNLPKHNEDFGQTLGRWGAETGPYLVLPLFGSSSIRDGLGLMVDFKADIVRNVDHIPTRNTLYAMRSINTRANLLDIGKVAEEAALDKYRFMRDAYFQRRRNLVYDGNPPRESESSALPEQSEQPDVSLAVSPAVVMNADESDALGILVVQPVTARAIDQSSSN
jgi:phospholipid-binding lipoprotein MlaA